MHHLLYVWAAVEACGEVCPLFQPVIPLLSSVCSPAHMSSLPACASMCSGSSEYRYGSSSNLSKYHFIMIAEALSGGTIERSRCTRPQSTCMHAHVVPLPQHAAHAGVVLSRATTLYSFNMQNRDRDLWISRALLLLLPAYCSSLVIPPLEMTALGFSIQSRVITGTARPFVLPACLPRCGLCGLFPNLNRFTHQHALLIRNKDTSWLICGVWECHQALCLQTFICRNKLLILIHIHNTTMW